MNLFLEKFINWSKEEGNILAVVLVGSYAREAQRPDSDIDLVIITQNPKVYLVSDNWTKTFGEVMKISNEDWGLVQVRRVFYKNALEVEFGITTKDWLDNPGSKKIIEKGMKMLYQRE